MATIYLSNDNLFSVSGLKAASSGSFMNDATVTLTLKTTGGSTVSGQTFPVTLSYISGTDGNYQTTLENTLVISASTAYVATITATSSSGLYAEWEMTLNAEKRTL